MAGPGMMAADSPPRRLLLLALLMALLGTTGLALGYSEKVQLVAVVVALLICIGAVSARYPWFAVGLPLLIFADLGISMSTGYSVAGVSLNWADLLLLPAVLPTVVRIAHGSRRFPVPNKAAALLLVLVGLATLLGVYYGNETAVIRNELHVLLYIFLAYFLAVTELRTRNDLRALLIMFMIAISLAGVKAIAIALIGSLAADMSLFQTVDISSQQLEGTRIILLGADTLFVVAIPILVALAVYVRNRLTNFFLAAAAIPICAGVLLGLSRSNWAAAAIAALLTLVLGLKAKGLKSLRTGLIALAGLILTLLLVSAFYYNSYNNSFFDIIQRRFSFNPSEGSGTMDYRIMEGDALLAVARHHIVLGSGLGSEYSYVDYRGLLITNWSHDGYLFLILKSGIIGLALFLLAMFLTIWKSVSLAQRSDDGLLASTGVGMSMALLALLLMSTLLNRISNMEGTYFIGLAVATPVVLASLQGKSNIPDVRNNEIE